MPDFSRGMPPGPSPAAPRSRDPQDYQDVARPVAAMPKDFPPGATVAPHTHPRAQLLFASSGTVTVSTRAGIWVLPPQRAAWLPPVTEHWLRMTGRVTMRTLYIRAEASPDLPRAPGVIAVPPLLRELILAAMKIPPLYDENGRDGRLIALILDEIRTLPTLPLHLPMPQDPRLARLCDAVVADPASDRDLAGWARAAGLSPRTLARLFRGEFGIGFAAWRRQARLLAALTRLAGDEPVTTVALDLGYDSPSAFTAMFHRYLGVTPSRYFAEP
jgi:AraC-like DNA-binding protein/mannose-6-phosphate isomerase-like protein (cupin superfamily)